MWPRVGSKLQRKHRLLRICADYQLLLLLLLLLLAAGSLSEPLKSQMRPRSDLDRHVLQAVEAVARRVIGAAR